MNTRLRGKSHEIFDLFLFIKKPFLGLCFTPQSVFVYNFKFAEIFEFEVNSEVSITLLSPKSFLR
jgi:hypothetical protein